MPPAEDRFDPVQTLLKKFRELSDHLAKMGLNLQKLEESLGKLSGLAGRVAGQLLMLAGVPLLRYDYRAFLAPGLMGGMGGAISAVARGQHPQDGALPSGDAYGDGANALQVFIAALLGSASSLRGVFGGPSSVSRSGSSAPASSSAAMPSGGSGLPIAPLPPRNVSWLDRILPRIGDSSTRPPNFVRNGPKVLIGPNATMDEAFGDPFVAGFNRHLSDDFFYGRRGRKGLPRFGLDPSRGRRAGRKVREALGDVPALLMRGMSPRAARRFYKKHPDRLEIDTDLAMSRLNRGDNMPVEDFRALRAKQAGKSKRDAFPGLKARVNTLADFISSKFGWLGRGVKGGLKLIDKGVIGLGQLTQNEMKRVTRMFTHPVESLKKFGKGVVELTNSIALMSRAITPALFATTALIGQGLAIGSPEAFNTLTGSFQLLLAAIGEAFMPIALQLSLWLQQVTDYVRNLDTETVQNIARWVMWGVGIGAAILVAAKLIAVFQALITVLGGVAAAAKFAFTHWPVAAVLAIVAGIYLLVRALNEASEAARRVGENAAQAVQQIEAQTHAALNARQRPSRREFETLPADLRQRLDAATPAQRRVILEEYIAREQGQAGRLEDPTNRRIQRLQLAMQRAEEAADAQGDGGDWRSRHLRFRAMSESFARSRQEGLIGEEDWNRLRRGMGENILEVIRLPLAQSQRNVALAQQVLQFGMPERFQFRTARQNINDPGYSTVEEVHRRIQLAALRMDDIQTELLRRQVAANEAMQRDVQAMRERMQRGQGGVGSLLPALPFVGGFF